jgi:hypothetical protein
MERVELRSVSRPNLWRGIGSMVLGLLLPILVARPSLAESASGSGGPVTIDGQRVLALLEAFRQTVDDMPARGPGLFYSDWRVEADRIPLWSRLCLGKELTPGQFASSPVTAKAVLTCVLRTEFRSIYDSNRDESLTVLQLAAWWASGERQQYNQIGLAPYTQMILRRYKDQIGIGKSEPIAAKPEAPKPETPKPETPNPEAIKPEAPKPETPKPEASKPEAAKPEPPNPAPPSPAPSKPAAPKPAPSKPATPKPATPPPATSKPATPKPVTSKPATPKPATPKPETPKPTEKPESPPEVQPSPKPEANPSEKPATKPTAKPDSKPIAIGSEYDRYMALGYRNTQQKNYEQAALYFRRALDDRPKDSYADRALKNIETIIGDVIPPAPPSTSTTPTGQWTEVATNVVGDRFMVAPSSIQTKGKSTAYWEYRAFVQPNPGLVSADFEQPVYSAMIYRVTECGTTVRVRTMRAFDRDRKLIHEQAYTATTLPVSPGSSLEAVTKFVCGSRSKGK